MTEPEQAYAEFIVRYAEPLMSFRPDVRALYEWACGAGHASYCTWKEPEEDDCDCGFYQAIKPFDLQQRRKSQPTQDYCEHGPDDATGRNCRACGKPLGLVRDVGCQP